MRRLATVLLFATTLAVIDTPADAVMRTVCPSLCNHTRIQAALNASTASGDIVWIQSTYNAVAAGETFPLNTLQSPGNLTIQGEGVDVNGNPTTTIAITTNPGQPDGLIINTPGTLIKDLRFVPTNATPIFRVIASADRLSLLHVNGMTLDNVVIDWTGGVAGNGAGLIADNVTIQNSTFRMISGNSIFVDGDNYLIQNNTLVALDAGNVIRGTLAMGFGADLKTPSQGECTGPPTGYTIQNNVITGFVDGIQWCTGRDTVIRGNVITDIAQSAILTSGSVRTLIEGNTITQNTVGGLQGIGMSANVFQGCDANVIRSNVITGRPVRDLQRGIVAQGCTTSQIVANQLTNFADAGGSIFYVMNPGQATASIIQGNTVRAGNASGIVYFGSDAGGTAVDGTVIQYNVVTDHLRNGLVVQGMKSGFNVVAHNLTRGTNLGGFAGTHGYSLQNLGNTVIDRNEALDTRGAGVGYFFANAVNLQGTCNTGAANGGGLMGQVGVQPAFANLHINCRLAQFTRHDFDGDGRADIAVFRGVTGEWIIRNSGNPGGPAQVIAWGCPVVSAAVCDDVLVPADYDGDGIDDVAVYRFGTGEWFIRRSSNGQLMAVAWGAPGLGDIPVPGRYTTPGSIDIAVYRTSTGEWLIRRSTDLAMRIIAHGAPALGDVPVPGDYDGDGRTDAGVYRQLTGEWLILRSSNGSLFQVAFGSPFLADLPVPANYTESTGMRRTDIAVYRLFTGQWLIRRATDGGLTTISWGAPTLGDVPVPGNYTDPNRTDLAVYRLSDGTWTIRRSSDGAPIAVPWGAPAFLDEPLTSR
jgi:hypothetical protein